MTPMFSAYVVVGEPPNALASAVARPSAPMARPMYGSRSSPVISATALTWPVFSAISAMTPGQDEQDERQREARAVHDGDAVGQRAAGEADPVRAP